MASPYASYRPSLQTHAHRMSSVNVLLVDPDARLTALLRRVLGSLGFGAIYVARDGTEALRLLGEKPIDLAITDWNMAPMDGLSFIETVRRGAASPNKRLPILMLTGRAKRRHVELARDAGVTEFLVKPFTVRTLCDRIILVIEQPRDFVMTNDYSGPDRRRRQRLPPGARDRRSRSMDGQIVAHSDEITIMRKGDEDVAIVRADYSLKAKIGDLPLSDIFNAESVARAQRIIHQSRGDFLGWITSDLQKLEDALGRLERNLDHGHDDVEMLSNAALHIKSQSGTFDYELASQVADSMCDLALGQDQMNRRRLMAARKHLDALYVIFQRNIQGNGGTMGQELMQSLAALTRMAE